MNCDDRVILHCDINNFFASVECATRPELAGRPVAVGKLCKNARVLSALPHTTRSMKKYPNRLLRSTNATPTKSNLLALTNVGLTSRLVKNFSPMQKKSHMKSDKE